MAGLVAVVAGLGGTIVSAGRAATAIVISAGWASVGGGIILATLLAELN
jgi:hypothetical protein